MGNSSSIHSRLADSGNDMLIGGLEHFLFSIIYGIILPID